eukprot:scaffold4990_cov387-Prasinococcus_capsulatus_cf.AAC.28
MRTPRHEKLVEEVGVVVGFDWKQSLVAPPILVAGDGLVEASLEVAQAVSHDVQDVNHNGQVDVALLQLQGECVHVEGLPLVNRDAHSALRIDAEVGRAPGGDAAKHATQTQPLCQRSVHRCPQRREARESRPASSAAPVGCTSACSREGTSLRSDARWRGTASPALSAARKGAHCVPPCCHLIYPSRVLLRVAPNPSDILFPAQRRVRRPGARPARAHGAAALACRARRDPRGGDLVPAPSPHAWAHVQPVAARTPVALALPVVVREAALAARPQDQTNHTPRARTAERRQPDCGGSAPPAR